MLIALVARANAAPADTDLAVRFADALTGEDHDDGDDDAMSADDTDDDNAGEAGGARDLGEIDAPVDDPVSSEDEPGGRAGPLASSTAGGDEAYEAAMRHRRPSIWGRLDVGVSLRRSTTAPLHTPAYRHAELWLVATWRH